MAGYSPIRITQLGLSIVFFVLCGALSRQPAIAWWQIREGSAQSAQFPSGVADWAHDTAFIRNAEGIDSLDLRSGRMRWRSAAASAPLVLIEGGSELVAANFENESLLLVAIESSSGIVKQSWNTSVGAHLSPYTCEITTDLVASVLQVRWTVHAAYKGGANPSRTMEERARVDAAGLMDIDLKTGLVLKREQADANVAIERHEWPNAIRSVTFGSRVYSIVAEDSRDEGTQGITGVALVARELRSGRVLWKYRLAVTAGVGSQQRQRP